MKRAFCFLIVFLATTTLFAQPILIKGGDTKELKDCVSKYCTVFMVQSVATNYTLVSTDEGLAWSFAEKETGAKKKFLSITHLFNFMDQSGWQYVDKIEDAITLKMVYLFEKKK